MPTAIGASIAALHAAAADEEEEEEEEEAEGGGYSLCLPCRQSRLWWVLALVTLALTLHPHPNSHPKPHPSLSPKPHPSPHVPQVESLVGAHQRADP